ncbi:unnamed protein product [Moneuplotes crassus]|uniref:SNF7 family protein n=1 Tax=Euplotes crassus TaxID=5936 RepID=A0AAD1XRS2_EUPCR|nr:unnamed protein product [Moneuplotes crassus]
MSWLFGGKKKKTKKAPQKIDIYSTKKKIDDQVKFTEMKITKHEKLIEDLKQDAKAALKKKDRKKAIMLMKKKKLYEAEISKLEGMRMMMEQQQMNMDREINNKNVFECMIEGNKAVEHLTKEADIDQFEDIREKHIEFEDRNLEINDFFAGYLDDQCADAEDDIQELIDEIEKEEMDKINNIINRPLPAAKVHSKEERVSREEEDLLAELN